MGASAGVIPCSSALAVLLGAIAPCERCGRSRRGPARCARRPAASARAGESLGARAERREQIVGWCKLGDATGPGGALFELGVDRGQPSLRRLWLGNAVVGELRLVFAQVGDAAVACRGTSSLTSLTSLTSRLSRIAAAPGSRGPPSAGLPRPGRTPTAVPPSGARPVLAPSH